MQWNPLIIRQNLANLDLPYSYIVGTFGHCKRRSVSKYSDGPELNVPNPQHKKGTEHNQNFSVLKGQNVPVPVPYYDPVRYDVYLTHVFSEWIVLEAELHSPRLLHFLLWRKAGQLGARTEKLQPNKKFKNKNNLLFYRCCLSQWDTEFSFSIPNRTYTVPEELLNCRIPYQNRAPVI
jgi:hypothetical protein